MFVRINKNMSFKFIFLIENIVYKFIIMKIIDFQTYLYYSFLTNFALFQTWILNNCELELNAILQLVLTYVRMNILLGNCTNK